MDGNDSPCHSRDDPRIFDSERSLGLDEKTFGLERLVGPGDFCALLEDVQILEFRL
jgi:hypothetical protein